MQMLGNEVLVTATRLWRKWSDPRFVVCVLHNNDLNQVTWEQRVMEGDPKFKSSQDLPDFPFAQYAELLGMRGIRLEHAEDVPDALDNAFTSDRPVVIDALTDPDEIHIGWVLVLPERHPAASANPGAGQCNPASATPPAQSAPPASVPAAPPCPSLRAPP